MKDVFFNQNVHVIQLQYIYNDLSVSFCFVIVVCLFVVLLFCFQQTCTTCIILFSYLQNENQASVLTH